MDIGDIRIKIKNVDERSVTLMIWIKHVYCGVSLLALGKL
jgi:hypothetical protein